MTGQMTLLPYPMSPPLEVAEVAELDLITCSILSCKERGRDSEEAIETLLPKLIELNIVRELLKGSL